MDLNKDAQIDTGQVRDVRGSGGLGGGGLGRIPIPIGGGVLGLILTALLVVGALVGGTALSGDGDGALARECSTENPDRLNRLDCRNALYINSIQAYWVSAMPDTFGQQYAETDTVFFSQGVNTGCGAADSGVGPFYCPVDDHVYIDLTFYQELAERFGAEGEFAQPYVLAHEYGHHVQDLTGTQAQIRALMERDPDKANQYSVMLELQADCYAGAWTKHATQTKDVDGRPIFKSVTQQDIDQALDAAAAVGDDSIQERQGGRIDESSFTHGSAEQRKQWFSTGYRSGDPEACDTMRGVV